MGTLREGRLAGALLDREVVRPAESELRAIRDIAGILFEWRV